MVTINVPDGLPKCELLRVLADKVHQRQDTDFNFFGRLDEFRQRVCAEVRQINELFPEYTPHDEQYHLKRLFHVADTVLSADRFDSMNSAELFVLAIAVYGHDWGMAVSETERQFILIGELPGGIRAEDMWILPDEHNRLAKFAREERLTEDSAGRFSEMPLEIWREYVRQTHAYRSGERVRRFFEPINGSVADAVSRVCEGHWLDFENLEQHDRYPANFSVLGETVNLRALAVYLRLIDLLDLGEDRTPFVIWKYVAPRNQRSKMSWEKHRALRNVTCPAYQEGRIIQVDGSTDNHNVYAALEDFRIWCEEQLRGCNDILARMNDPRHKLDIYHINWRVLARGFNPVLIQFEFCRERMFELLGEEIYQQDPYVFLRELLQNSIDAIRMRREIIRKNAGIEPREFGLIRITAEHRDNGDSVITFRDNGIGMDEHIIRNYLAVAGRSYYRSEDFGREGLSMDPISRFGIGVLSCFVVADRIEIETFKDPNFPPQSYPCKITIPDMRRQFRIERLSQESSTVGTTFRIFVDGNKLPIDNATKSVTPLDVTAYLSVVAGFVEFPVIIEEGKRKIIIVHPKEDPEAVRKHFGMEFEVQQLDMRYPWSEAFYPQDLSRACEIFREEHFDVASIIDIEEYEGRLTYLIPKDKVADFVHTGHSWPTQELRPVIQGQIETSIHPLRWTDAFSSWSRHIPREGRLSRSSFHAPTYSVYIDGILLPTASPPMLGKDSGFTFAAFENPPVPNLVINLPKSETLKIDLSRTEFVETDERWDSKFWDAFIQHFFDFKLKDLTTVEAVKRLHEIAWVSFIYRIPASMLMKFIPHEYWPMLFMESKLHLSVLDQKDVRNEVIYQSPGAIDGELALLIGDQWSSIGQYHGALRNWEGEKCIIQKILNYVYDVPTEFSCLTKQKLSLCSLPLELSHHCSGTRFLESPWEGDPPLIQRIWSPTEAPDKLPEMRVIMKEFAEDPAAVNPVVRSILFAEISKSLHAIRNFSKIDNVADFFQPFHNFFAYGYDILNFKHPLTQQLIKYIARLYLTKNNNSIPAEDIGRLEDALLSLPFWQSGTESVSWDQFEGSVQNLWKIAGELGLFTKGEINNIMVTPEEFVPGTIDNNFILSPEDPLKRLAKMESSRPFGKPITKL